MNLNWVILIIGGIFESLFALSLGKMQDCLVSSELLEVANHPYWKR
jgi:hypothetical protein